MREWGVMSDEKKLVRLDPDSEACFEGLSETIEWELSARLAVGDDVSSAEGRRALAGLIADSILDRFVTRERSGPRSRFE